MDNIADTLQADFDAFIDQPVPMAFFSGLSDYVGFVLETPQLKAIVDEVMKGKIDMYDELDELETKALEEIRAAKEKLLKIIKDNNVDPALLTINLSSAPGVSHDHNLLEQLELFESDHVRVSGFRSRTLEMYLFDIAAALANMGYADQLKEFMVSGEQYGRIYEDEDGESRLHVIGNVHGNFVFSKTAELLTKKDAQIDRVSGFGMWTAFDPLLKLHEAYVGRSKGMVKHAFLNDYIQRHTPRNAAEAGDLSDVSLAFDDLRGIADGKALVGPNVYDTYKHFLNASEFKGYATRAHRHLLKELPIRTITQGNGTQEKGTNYDEGRGILHVMGREVRFRKFTEQYHTLRVIFSDPHKEWFFSELAEKIDRTKGYTDKDFHNYLSAIKRRVSAEAGIKDLFITTTQSVKLNPAYLK